jgi:hypothetical protein
MALHSSHPDYRGAIPKPSKGSALLKRRADRKAIELEEEKEKAKVRKRDRGCRWPRCECKALKNIALHVAHLDDKGMGGDHGLRSRADRMIHLCFLRHEGQPSLHSGDLAIVPQTDAGTDGPCDFYARHADHGRLELVASERTIGISVERTVR